MDFYYADVSAYCRSIMLTAKAVGVELNKIPINLLEKEQMKPEFIAINPQHCVPTLVDGDLKLWESRAICTYLVSQYGKDDTLYPKEPKQRVIIDRLLYFDIGTLMQRFAEYVYPVLFGFGEPVAEKLERLNEALGWLEGYIAGHDFCVGKNITVADFVLISSISSVIDADLADMSKYPNIDAWAKRCKTEMTGYETENGKGSKEFGEWIKSQFAAYK